MKTSVNDSSLISWSINSLYKKCAKKPKKENQTKPPPKKSTTTLEQAIQLLSKHKSLRTKTENKIINNYLSENFSYFKKIRDNGDTSKLEKLIAVLNLETFKANQNIIRFGEEGDKFYILLDGTVGIYKPIYVQKDMKLKEYLGMMSDVKYVEIDELKYNRINEKNSNLNLDLDTLFKMSPDAYSMRVKYTFFVEEEQKLGEFGQGFAFGEIALIKRCTRNATIKALKPSSLVSIDKSDYNKVLRELEEKRLEKVLLVFKRNYPLFQFWTLNQLIRLFNCFSKISVTQGDYLYKQNEDADSIFIIQSGIFEVYSLVSYGWINDFFGYIVSAKNNMLHCLEERALKETELREKFDAIQSSAEKSPCQYDPLKVAKIITSIDKKEDFIDIKQSEEEVNDPYNLFKVLIRTINYQDVIGIEDALEVKKRFNFVKCISSHGEVQKVSLYDFFRLININPEINIRKGLMDIIAKKKAILYKKILTAAKKRSRLIENLMDYKYEEFVATEGGDERAKLIATKFRPKDAFDFLQSTDNIKPLQLNHHKSSSVIISKPNKSNSLSPMPLIRHNHNKHLTLSIKQTLPSSLHLRLSSHSKRSACPVVLKHKNSIETQYKHFFSLSKKNPMSDNTTNESSQQRTVCFMSNSISHNKEEEGSLNRIKSMESLKSKKKSFDLYKGISDKKMFLMRDYNDIVSKELIRMNSTRMFNCHTTKNKTIKGFL